MSEYVSVKEVIEIDTPMAGRIYDILVFNAGSQERMRDNFIYWLCTQGKRNGEYRFQGVLGFGGKFWLQRYRLDGQPEWFVNYYPEDKTRGRDRLVIRTNKALAELWAAEKAEWEKKFT